jgi:hypothetical protein
MKLKLKKILAAPFVLIAAVIVILEDWLWDDLARMMAFIGRLPILRQLENVIANLPPYAALAVFVVPSLLLIPVKLSALWLISHGQHALGLFTVIGAKIIGTALVARIYTLTQGSLLKILWFATLHGKFTAFKAKVYGYIKATAVYQSAHELKVKLKKFVQGRGKAFWKKRWEAARRFARR